MDPNLHFRFMIPAWAGAIAAFAVNWAMGGDWLTKLAGPGKDAPWVALVLALLASPAIGFLLNSVVAAVCHLIRWGPVYSPVFREFHTRVQDAASTMPTPNQHLIERISPAAIVAHFEYRCDRADLLEWRRRQRAGFFTDWTAILALALGVWAGLHTSGDASWYDLGLPIAMVIVAVSVYGICTRSSGNKQLGEWQSLWVLPGLLSIVLAACGVYGIVCSESRPLAEGNYVLSALLVLCFSLPYMAWKSQETDIDQQRLWVESWTNREIIRYLKTYGIGTKRFPEGK